MWMRQSAAPLDFMQFRSVNSSMVAGSYAMGTGFQLGVFDGKFFVSQLHGLFSYVYSFQDGHFYSTLDSGPLFSQNFVFILNLVSVLSLLTMDQQILELGITLTTFCKIQFSPLLMVKSFALNSMNEKYICDPSNRLKCTHQISASCPS